MSKKNQDQTNEMIKLYDDGLSYAQIGNVFGVTRQSVWERLKRAGVKSRIKKTLPYIMYDNIKWTISKSTGYYRNTDRTSRGMALSLHRYKYEKEVKKVPDNWDVHHIDEDKLNNCISNLTSLSKADHTRLHSTGHNQYKNNKTIKDGTWKS
tara:strand:- start:461 stop:916 length:456 start_codon:yes stop_codon:yes gene_type:complete